MKNNFLYKSSLYKSLLAATALCMFSHTPALAADFEQGCQYYQSKNYASARASFEKAVQIYPNNWLVRYYMANTYLALGQQKSAKREYEQCLTSNPNAATAKFCQDALMKIGGQSPAPALVAVGPADAATEGAVLANPGLEVKDKATLDKEAQLAVAMAKAEAQCAAIRAEAKEKLSNGHITGNQWYISSSDLTLSVDLRPEEKEAITAEAEERCNQVMHLVERQTQHLRPKP